MDRWGEVVDRLGSDPGFRVQFEADPTGALVAEGFELSPEEITALGEVDFASADEALLERVSKQRARH